MTNLPADYVSNAEKFRESYRRERAVELMFENHRWWDLRRWMIMTTVFKNPTSLYGVKFYPIGNPPVSADAAEKAGKSMKPEGFTMEKFLMTQEIRAFGDNRNYWYPLPQHDVDALDNLQQNPGWE